MQFRVDLSVSQTTDDEQSQISVLKANSYLVVKLELSHFVDTEVAEIGRNSERVD